MAENKLRFAASSHVGNKAENQDTTIMEYISDTEFACGVFDGHGKEGLRVSTFIKEYAFTLFF